MTEARRIDEHMIQATLRADFASWVRKCATLLSPGQVFASNWHHLAMAHALEEVRLGRSRRLIMNIPPRSLKSITASVAFPAYVLGHNPSARLVCVSYSNDLTAKLSNDFRAIVTHPFYRALFPHMRIDRNTEEELTTDHYGGRLAVSVGGTLTGRGGDIVIIDDPLKPQDAFSEARREWVNEWFRSTLLSRLDDQTKGAIVIVSQRVHLNDLSAFVMELHPGWKLLALPAIAEEDQDIPIGLGR